MTALASVLPGRAALPYTSCKTANKHPCLVTGLSRSFQAQPPKYPMVPSGQCVHSCLSSDGGTTGQGHLSASCLLRCQSLFPLYVQGTGYPVHPSPRVGHFSHSFKVPILEWHPSSRAVQDVQDSHCFFPLLKCSPAGPQPPKPLNHLLLGEFRVYCQIGNPCWLWRVLHWAVFPMDSTPPIWSCAIIALA